MGASPYGKLGRNRVGGPKWLAALAGLVLLAGCTSNRFQYANPAAAREDLDLATRTPPPPPLQPPVQAIPTDVPFAQPLPPPVGVPANGIPAVGPLPPPGAGAGLAINPAIPENPNPANTGVMNRRRLTETPRPGEPGSQLQLAPDGPELVGRVVNSFGQPEAKVAIQVLDVGRGRRVVAELASSADGSFRVRNLEHGGQYELRASTADNGRRLVGQTMAVAPDTGVVIQVEPEDGRSFSPLGNRLSSVAQARGSEATSPRIGRPIASGDGRLAPVSRGSLAVSTPPLRGWPEATAARTRPEFRRLGPEEARPLAAAMATATGERAEPAEPGRFPTPRNTSPTVKAPDEQNPSFGGPELAGVTVLTTAKSERRIGDLKGDLVLFDFFGSWCGPCRRSIPKLNALQERYRDRGLVVVGIACERGSPAEATSQAESARQELGIDYAVLVSPLDEASSLRDHFHVEEYPTLALVDRSGRVLYQGSGTDPQTMAALEQAIRQAVSRLELTQATPPTPRG